MKTRDATCEFIREYREKNGYSPSFREIAAGLGVSLTTVNYHLHRLRDEGKIQFNDKISRSVVLVEKP